MFVVAVVANPYLIPLLIFLSVLIVFLRWYYIKTARDVKRLEAIGIHERGKDYRWDKKWEGQVVGGAKTRVGGACVECAMSAIMIINLLHTYTLRKPSKL